MRKRSPLQIKVPSVPATISQASQWGWSSFEKRGGLAECSTAIYADTMPLVKLARDVDVLEGQLLVKESHDRVIVLTRCNGQLMCWEVPGASCESLQQCQDLPSIKYTLKPVNDDGVIWAMLPDDSVKKAASASNQCARIFKDHADAVPLPPTPLIPFAGCDKKPMPPSPAAKPFAPHPSPVKPSPLKERVDVATTAVARKNWGQRQAKMGEFFGSAKPNVPPPNTQFVPGPEEMDI